MTTGRWDPEILTGNDALQYVTLSTAADATGVSSETARHDFNLFLAKGLVDLPRGRGRPPVHVVRFDEVMARRAALLRKLGVETEEAPDEVRELKRRTRELESQLAEREELIEAFRVAHESGARLASLLAVQRSPLSAGREIEAGP